MSNCFYQIVPDPLEEFFEVHVVRQEDDPLPDDYLGQFSSIGDAFEALRVYHSRLDR